MQINIQEAIKKEPALASGIGQATAILEEEVGPSTDRVQADWALARGEWNHRVVKLRLSEPAGTVEGYFAPEEFQDSSHLQGRLGRLWRELLTIRADKESEELQKKVAQLDGE
jgi:hypothetical protein